MTANHTHTYTVKSSFLSRIRKTSVESIALVK